MHVCISMHPILFTTNHVNTFDLHNYVMCYGAHKNIIYLLTYDSSITITLKLHQFLIVEHQLFCYFCIRSFVVFHTGTCNQMVHIQAFMFNFAYACRSINS